jgi:glycosyltransferase involved in cell wall biosynthesis
MQKPKVSIIIPIYNSAQYLEKCLVSLFEQTLDDLEYIFINDGSIDNSMEVLSKTIKNYPHRAKQVKIFDNKINRGIAVTRNTGITNANGEYIIHGDSDDWVELDMYKTMYEKAVSGNYDIVYCDYYRVIDNKPIHKKAKNVETNTTAIKSILTRNGNVTTFLVDKLVKRELYRKNNILFSLDFNILEDISTTVRLFYYAKTISHVPAPLYYYDIKNESISKTKKKYGDNSYHISDRIKANEFIYDFFAKEKVLDVFEREINNSKLHTKYQLINFAENKKPALRLFPEANKSIKSYPSFSAKFVLLFASWNCEFLVAICLWKIRVISSLLKHKNN